MSCKQNLQFPLAASKWTSYATGATAAGLMMGSPDAEAVVVHATPNLSAQSGSLYIDFETATADTSAVSLTDYDFEIQIASYTTLPTLWAGKTVTLSSPNVDGRDLVFVNGSGDVASLSPSTDISSLTFPGFSAMDNFDSSFANATSYFGVEIFSTDGSSNEENFYGWVKLTIDLDPISGFVRVDEFAYNSVPGQALAIGATAIPEASHTVLFLAGGIALLTAYRRRKNKTAC